MYNGNCTITKEKFLTKCKLTEEKYEELKKKFIKFEGKREVSYYDSTREFSGVVVESYDSPDYYQEISYRITNTDLVNTGEASVQIRSYVIMINFTYSGCELIYRYNDANSFDIKSKEALKCKAYIWHDEQMISVFSYNLNIMQAIKWAKFISIWISKECDNLYEKADFIFDPQPVEIQKSKKRKCKNCNEFREQSEMEKQLLLKLDEILPNGGWNIVSSLKRTDMFTCTLRKDVYNEFQIIKFDVRVINFESGKYTFDIKLYSYYRNGYSKKKNVQVSYTWESAHQSYYLSIVDENRSCLSITFLMCETNIQKIINIVNENFKRKKENKYDKCFKKLIQTYTCLKQAMLEEKK